MNYKVLMEAVEGLTKPEDIQAYYTAYKVETKKLVSKEVQEGKDSSAVDSIQSGEKTLDEVTESLAHDHFSYLLNKYSDPKIHDAWQVGLSFLYPKGRLQNMVETAL